MQQKSVQVYLHTFLLQFRNVTGIWWHVSHVQDSSHFGVDVSDFHGGFDSLYPSKSRIELPNSGYYETYT
jgi:hypothetical protein